MQQTHTVAAVIAACLIVGCADDESVTSAVPTVAATEVAAAEPTATPAGDAREGDGCVAPGVAISITGGEGVSCKTARRIYLSYRDGKVLPKGWECAVRACTKVDGDDVRDFTWTSRTTTDTSSAEPTASSSTLDGTYAMQVREGDSGKSGGASPGRWRLTIASGDATLDGPGGRHIPLNPTSLSEKGMVVPADDQCPNNDPAPGEGTYELAQGGTGLKFRKLSDPCRDRAFTLTVHEWRRTTD